MQVSYYQLQELHFAYCYHAYLHWRTHRRRAYPELVGLDRAALHALVEPLGIHVFECDSRPKECRALVSLRPEVGENGSVTLHLNVVGRSIADVSRFIEALERSPEFEKVIVSIEQKEPTAATDVNITLTANYFPQRETR